MTRIRVATDCSGIEAPLEALKQLKIPFHQVFTSEIDKTSIEICALNYPEPDLTFTDLTKRDHNELKNLDIDLYVCGFPCQSFSSTGKLLGFADERGKIVYSVIKTIKAAQPKYFILENVKNLTQGKNKQEFLNVVIQLSKGYNVQWKILNTKDFGLPQNRERVYIVGTRKDLNQDFEFPEKIPLKKSIENFIDLKNKSSDPIPVQKQRVLEKYREKKNGFTIISNGDRFARVFDKGFCPTIMSSGKSFIYDLGRYMTADEALKLQGFGKIKKGAVIENKVHSKAGNSMSVNVLKLIIKNLFK